MILEKTLLLVTLQLVFCLFDIFEDGEICAQLQQALKTEMAHALNDVWHVEHTCNVLFV